MSFRKVAGVSSSDVYSCKAGTNDRSWNGTLTNAFVALHLGVHTNQLKRPVGYVIVSHSCVIDQQGWDSVTLHS